MEERAMKVLSLFMFFWSWVVALITAVSNNNTIDSLVWVLAAIAFAIIYAGTIIAEAIKSKK